MKKYMKRVHHSVCQNGGTMKLSDVERPGGMKGMTMKQIFEEHGKSYFTLQIIGEGDSSACFIHAKKDRSAFGKTFIVGEKTICYYVKEPSKLASALDRLFADIECVVSVDCEGVPESLELLQIATGSSVYIFDCHQIGAEQVCQGLKSLLENETPVKLIHDLRNDAIALEAFGGIKLSGALDTQLLAELFCGSPFEGFNAFLSRLDLPKHPSKDFVHGRMNSGINLWDKRPIAQTSLEYAAMDVAFLQNAAERIQEILAPNHLDKLIHASSIRAQNAIKNKGYRAICFDKENTFAIASTELMMATRPKDGFFGEKLKIESDVDEIFDVLPSVYNKIFVDSEKKNHSLLGIFTRSSPTSKRAKEDLIPIELLNDIVLDIGRRALCWIDGSRVHLCDDEDKVVTQGEIEEITARLGTFGSDNRAGLDVGITRKMGSLHRFSAMRDRDGQIIGMTIRIGRNVLGNAAMLMDVLNHTNMSVLILGEPGSGKTTIVREATRMLAQDKNVIVVDTSNEIAGDGKTPHRCIGLARRMMVPSLDKQSAVMIECVQNHTPHVMVIDEIGRPKEVQAASTVKQRGVRLIASAHGNLRGLLKNKDLNGLVGGQERITIGDEMAKEEAKRKKKLALDQGGNYRPVGISKTQTKRRSDPTFEIIVEVSRESRNEWRIVTNSAKAVDRILDGFQYQCQLRKRDPATGEMWMEFGHA
ncbi:unnamed protein product [Pseudo-nitzschia multistriata]|uniref:AAA+ ATPase domain-containing protein n=1 Tax=Pseudo-nitzschia multistriata TaxID=183589 RepID=A0A448ZPL9_9STRA|nr:unnamed protein product [Pseudo-nitzschia multistriata]